MKYFLTFLPLFFFLNVEAQLCDGSFGDAVFTETFGNDFATGNTYGPALLASETTYRYVSTNNVQDGEYTVSVNPQRALSNFFNTTDHTNDISGRGYMLIVNADFTPGEFYRRTVSDLCNSQVYEFSAFLMNVLPSTETSCETLVPNNVIFRIEDGSGNNLGEITTGIINSTATAQWVRYSFDFQAPSDLSDIQVVLINNAPGGCGNDLAIDDISFRPCSAGASVITNYIDFERGVCEDDTIEFIAEMEGAYYIAPEFQWQESIDNGFTWMDLVGETNSSITISGFINGHSYRYIVAENGNISNSNCRAGSRLITVNYLNVIENEPLDLQKCDFSQTKRDVFNLRENEDQIIGSQDSENLKITYYKNIDDAENNENLITNPENYTNIENNQEIFVRVEDTRKGCFNTTSFLLIVSGLVSEENAPEISITVEDGKVNNTIVVNIPQDVEFEYSFDNGAFQESNILENVVSGIHTVIVRNQNPCGVTGPVDVCVVGFPNFFTPNGDGMNDIWNVQEGVSGCYDNTIITIFNRYGKLIKQIFPAGEGWDGTFNGKLLPSSDYWFSIKLNNSNQREFIGHFTLKR